jgi:YHS domain-containing protein
MPEGTAKPLFIFLPMRGPDGDESRLVVDAVCGRSVAEGKIAGWLLYGGRRHYFCSLDCAERFVASVREPEMR